jgi:hypothetical protein
MAKSLRSFGASAAGQPLLTVEQGVLYGRRRPKRPSPVLPTGSCNRTPISGGRSKTASIPEQLPAIMPEVPAVPPEIHPIMMNVRQVSTDICPTAESQITTKIAPIPPQVSAVPPQIKAVGLQVLSIQVLSIGTDVSTVTISIPIGRSNRRREAHAADESRGSQDNHTLAHHNLLLLLAPRFGSVDHVLFALNRTCVAGSFWVHSCEARRAALFREDNGKLLAVLCV